jgi:hypothetical protein
MKRGSGIKGRDDRSSGIEIRITEALAKINPTDPLILVKGVRIIIPLASLGLGRQAEGSVVLLFICSRLKKR